MGTTAVLLVQGVAAGRLQAGVMGRMRGAQAALTAWGGTAGSRAGCEREGGGQQVAR